MSEPDQDRSAPEQLRRELVAKEDRKVRARKAGERSVWFGLGMFGLVGWSIAIPTLAGVALGAWLDSHWPSRISWKLTLLFVGVVVGFATAWRWMHRENVED